MFILIFILVTGFLTVIGVVVSASALVTGIYYVDGLGTSDATRLWQLEAR